MDAAFSWLAGIGSGSDGSFWEIEGVKIRDGGGAAYSTPRDKETSYGPQKLGTRSQRTRDFILSRKINRMPIIRRAAANAARNQMS